MTMDKLPNDLVGEIFRWVVDTLVDGRSNSDKLFELSKLCLVCVKFWRVVEDVCFCRPSLVADLDFSMTSNPKPPSGRCPEHRRDAYHNWIHSLGHRLQPGVVQTINLRGASFPNQDTFGSLLAHQKNVTLLDMQWTDISSQLVDMRHFAKLETLVLSNARLYQQQIDPSICFPLQVKDLNLAWVSSVDDNVVRGIATHMTSLETLSLKGCEAVTEVGLAYLARLSCQFRDDLQKLDIAYCSVTNAALILLANDLTNLSILELSAKTLNIWGPETWTLPTLDEVVEQHGNRLLIKLTSV